TSLFQPFRRARGPGGYCFSGTGLGLALTRKLVEAQGSTLKLDTQPGRGTRFFFELELPPHAPALADPSPSAAYRSRWTSRPSRSGVEELVQVRGSRRGVGKRPDAERRERQPQQALLLIEGRGPVASLGLRADDDARDPSAAVRAVPARLVEHHDQ